MGLFHSRKKLNGKTCVPVWFMRQAGRYHTHYQNIRKRSDFMTMCKTPELAREITMGPIDDFGFDAAILFSDLLFPLEQLGMGLTYEAGPPQLGFQLKTLSDVKQLKIIQPARDFYRFQADALTLLRDCLAPETTLLGFVGGPFTLYTYAVEGSHAGSLVSSKQGLYDGRYQAFCEKLLPELIENMIMQARGGADAVCILDTAAGELSLADYKRFLIPELKKVTQAFKAACPQVKVVYYAKHVNLRYFQSLEDDHIDVLGVDWRIDLVQALKELSSSYYVQGNIDPAWLHLSWTELEKNLQHFRSTMETVDRSRWVGGLGHGVLIQTPEENVRLTVKYLQEQFTY